tara:strand:- start:102 stop:359 length:258 start_codon:yes stop_codon:yes gene_type:complete
LRFLFAAAICHAGIAAFPAGAPVLKGLLRPVVEFWTEATDSVPVPLLTEAGFGVTTSVVEDPLEVVFGVGALEDTLDAPIPEGLL